MVMSKSMNVQFADGTSHTYDDVPDDVTQDQVNARAADDFPSRKIAGVGEGANENAAPLPSPEGAVEPTTGEKAAGVIQTAGQLAGEYGKQAAEIGGAAYGGYKGVQAINAYKANTAVTQMNGLLNGYSKMTHDIRQYEKAGQPVPQELRDAHARLGQQVEMAQSKVPGYNPSTTATPVAPTTTPNAGMANAQQGVNNMARGGPIPPEAAPTAAPRMAPNAAPTVAPAAPAANAINGANAAANEGWMARALQAAKQYAPAVEGVANKAAPVLKGMSKLALPLAVASELFYTSPEERAILKKAEDEKRAKGWKPVNER